MDKFARTRAALKAFDDYTEQVWEHAKWNTFDESFKERERLGREVGRAFGLDTPECNSVDTCESCVRPGHVRRFLVNESWKGYTS